MNRRVAAWTTAGALALGVGLVGVATASAAPSRATGPAGGVTVTSTSHRAQLKAMPSTTVKHKAVHRSAVRNSGAAGAATSRSAGKAPRTVAAKTARGAAAKGRTVSGKAVSGKAASARTVSGRADRGDRVSKAALLHDRAIDKRTLEPRARSSTA